MTVRTLINISAASLLALAAISPARGDQIFRAAITDANYWHHFTVFWDSSSSNSLGMIVWYKDPDPSRSYQGEWFQSTTAGNCEELVPTPVVGRLPIYEPGRLSGSFFYIDPVASDPCLSSPKSFSVLLQGQGVETWIYRTVDIQQALIGPSGYFHDGAWCTNTAATDATGTPIFEVRRMIAELEKYPRIARGQLGFIEANHDSGPVASLSMKGTVQVEHDPATLLPINGTVDGGFRAISQYSYAPLQQLQFWHEIFECPAPRPNPNASAVLRAASGIDRTTISIDMPK